MKNQKRKLDYKQIGEYRRKELEYFCLQYHDFVKENRYDLAEMIEQSAFYACSDMYSSIIRHVTTRFSNYDNINPPCERSQYYKALRSFYVGLANRRYPSR